MLTNMILWEIGLMVAAGWMLIPAAFHEQKELDGELLEYYVPLLQDFVSHWYENPVNEYWSYEFAIWEVAEYFSTNGINYSKMEIEKVLNLLHKFPSHSYLHVDKNGYLYSVSGMFPYSKFDFDRYCK